MSKEKAAVPLNTEFRDPKTFKHLDALWSDFISRWNDSSVTLCEAKGLLHEVANRMWWANEACTKDRIGEDSRETCIRFLMHYAGIEVRYDDEGQIQEKAYKVLTRQVLRSCYLVKHASKELLMDVLDFYTEHLPKSQPDERYVENFIKDVKRKNICSTFVWQRLERLANALFKSRFAIQEL